LGKKILLQTSKEIRIYHCLLFPEINKIVYNHEIEFLGIGTAEAGEYQRKKNCVPAQGKNPPLQLLPCHFAMHF